MAYGNLKMHAVVVVDILQSAVNYCRTTKPVFWFMFISGWISD